MIVVPYPSWIPKYFVDQKHPSKKAGRPPKFEDQAPEIRNTFPKQTNKRLNKIKTRNQANPQIVAAPLQFSFNFCGHAFLPPPYINNKTTNGGYKSQARTARGSLSPPSDTDRTQTRKKPFVACTCIRRQSLWRRRSKSGTGTTTDTTEGGGTITAAPEKGISIGKALSKV